MGFNEVRFMQRLDSGERVSHVTVIRDECSKQREHLVPKPKAEACQEELGSCAMRTQ